MYITSMEVAMNTEIQRWEKELAKSLRLNPDGAKLRISKRITDYLCSRSLGRPFGQTAEQYHMENPDLVELRHWKDAL
jgi:hypothetical protein